MSVEENPYQACPEFHDCEEPFSSLYQQSISGLKKEINKSRYRHRAVEIIRERMRLETRYRVNFFIRWVRRLCRIPEKPSVIQNELEWLEHFSDKNGFTMPALHADVLMLDGQSDEAKKKYRDALRHMRETESTEAFME